jgi:hypothetical protein
MPVMVALVQPIEDGDFRKLWPLWFHGDQTADSMTEIMAFLGADSVRILVSDRMPGFFNRLERDAPTELPFVYYRCTTDCIPDNAGSMHNKTGRNLVDAMRKTECDTVLFWECPVVCVTPW